jgi:hypothetical protein
MNDDEMLTALRSSLTGVKDSLTEVHLDRSADAIRARARGRQLRRGLAGAGAGGTALGVGLALALGGSGTSAPPVHVGAQSVHVNLDAWSVNTESGGLVYVDVRELQDAGLLRQTLARAGVPAIVTFGEFCTGASGGGNLDQVLGKSAVGGGKLTINPAAIPAGSELSIGIVSNPGKGFDNSFAIVKDGSRLTCGTTGIGSGTGKGSGAPVAPGAPARTKPGAGKSEKASVSPGGTGTGKTGSAG